VCTSSRGGVTGEHHSIDSAKETYNCLQGDAAVEVSIYMGDDDGGR
jgi:hypothetical protein